MKIEKKITTVEREVTTVVKENVEEYVVSMSRDDVETLFVITQVIGGSPETSDRGLIDNWASALYNAGIGTNTLSGTRVVTDRGGYRNVNREYLQGSLTFYKKG